MTTVQQQPQIGQMGMQVRVSCFDSHLLIHWKIHYHYYSNALDGPLI